MKGRNETIATKNTMNDFLFSSSLKRSTPIPLQLSYTYTHAHLHWERNKAIKLNEPKRTRKKLFLFVKQISRSNSTEKWDYIQIVQNKHINLSTYNKKIHNALNRVA